MHGTCRNGKFSEPSPQKKEKKTHDYSKNYITEYAVFCWSRPVKILGPGIDPYLDRAGNSHRDRGTG